MDPPPGRCLGWRLRLSRAQPVDAARVSSPRISGVGVTAHD